MNNNILSLIQKTTFSLFKSPYCLGCEYQLCFSMHLFILPQLFSTAYFSSIIWYAIEQDLSNYLERTLYI